MDPLTQILLTVALNALVVLGLYIRALVQRRRWRREAEEEMRRFKQEMFDKFEEQNPGFW